MPGYLRLGGLYFVDIDLIQRFFTAGSLLGFGSIRTEAADKLLQFFHPVFCLLILVRPLFQSQLARFVPKCIVTGVNAHFGKINIHHMRTNGI